MSYSLGADVVLSTLFVDARTQRAFAWLEKGPKGLYVSDWVAAELYALVQRRARAGLIPAETASAALREFDAFAGARAQRLSQSAAAGALAADLARDPALKLSAADALHLALSAHADHCLVTFDQRLAEAAEARGFAVEIP